MRLLSRCFLIASVGLLPSNLFGAQEEVQARSETSRQYERVSPRSSFEPTPAQQYRIARARQQSAHWAAILRAYEAAGIDYAHPVVSSSTAFTVLNPPRPKGFYYQPIYYVPMPQAPVTYPAIDSYEVAPSPVY